MQLAESIRNFFATQKPIISVAQKPSKGAIVSAMQETISAQVLNTQKPDGWDDIKTLLMLGLGKDSLTRKAAVSQLAQVAREARIRLMLLATAYNSIGEEIRKGAEDFPQYQETVKKYAEITQEYVQKQNPLEDVVRKNLRNDLTQILS